MFRLPSQNSKFKRFVSWLGWPFFILGVYVLLALLYRSAGWGLKVSYRDGVWSFSEPLPQGGEQRLAVTVYVPERLFMPLPWLDSPPPQAITFDFNAINLQKPYTLRADLEPDWMVQWVDETGKPTQPKWSFVPGRELPDAETLYLKPAVGIRGGEHIRFDIQLEPAIPKQGGMIELVVEEPFQAVRRRFLFLLFGEFATFIGVAIFVSGSLWQYSQTKRNEIIQQKQKELQEIIELSHKNLVDAIEKLIYLNESKNKSKWNEFLQSSYQDIIRQIKTKPWELTFIRNFDELLLKCELIRFNELLDVVKSFQEILRKEIQINQRSEKQIISEEKANNITQTNDIKIDTIDWEEVANLYRNSQTINQFPWNIVDTLWKEFDIEARELIAELLIRFTTHHPTEKDKIKEKLEETHNSRRICHHPRILEKFGELTTPLQYRWLYRPIIAPNLSQNIQNWLECRKNSFYPSRAEMESEETIKQSYYFTEHLKAIIEEPKGMVWIQAEPSSGRTALSLYLAYQAWDKRFFPVRLTWDPTETGPLAPVVMTAMAQAAAGEWLKVLPVYPAALLDLLSSRQQEVMQFLQWALGHRDSLSAILEKGRYTPEPGGPEVERGEERQRRMRVLQNRLQRFLADAPTPSSPTPLQLREWLGLRPAGLEGTCVILELPRPLAESAYDEVWSLAAALAEEKVYLRVIAPNVPKPLIPVVALRWTEDDLKAMLLAREVDRLFAPSDSKALDKLVAASHGLPRTMMILGQLAITAHVERKSRERYLDEEDVEEAIKRYNSLVSTK